MFEGKNYRECKINDIALKLTDGTHKTPTYINDGIAFISAKNIVNGHVDLSDIKHISESEYEEIQKRCSLEVGDILLTKSGTLGASAVNNIQQPLGLFESLAVIKTNPMIVDNIFLNEQLKSDIVQSQFKRQEKGVAVKHLHLNVIGNTTIILPPIELQRQFADFVTQVDKSK